MTYSKIYQSLPVKDGLVFGVVFSARSILDISPTGAAASINGTPKWIRSGGIERIQSGPTDYISLAHNAAQAWTTGSLYIRTEPLLGDATERRLLFKRSGVGQFDYKHTATALTFFGGGINSILNTTAHIGKRSHGTSIVAGGKAQFFEDGVRIGEGGLAMTPGVDSAPIVIGTGFSNNILVPTQAALGYNRALTASEWADIHAWSESLRSPTIPHDRRYFDMGSLVPNGPQTQYGPTGDDLVVDGDMEAAGTAAWALIGASAVVTKETGSPSGSGSQVLRVAYGGVNNPNVRQAITEIGGVYRVTGWVRGDGTGAPRFLNGAGSQIWLGSTSSSWEYVDFTFTNVASGNFYLSTAITGAGYSEFDNVTVEQTNNLLSDGDMEADGIGQYSAGNSATLTKETGTPYEGSQVLRVAYNAVNNPYASQPILVVGKKYRITGRARSDGAAIPRVENVAIEWTGTASVSWQAFDVEVVATGTSVILRANTLIAGYCEFDSVLVREVFETELAYDFSEIVGRTAIDKSGGGHSGVMTGEIQTARTDMGLVVRMLGANSPKGVITVTPNITGQDDIALETLIYIRSLGDVAGRLVQSTSFNVYFSGSPITTIVVTMTGVTGSAWSVAGIPQDEWFHLVITRKRSTGQFCIWVNGVAIKDSVEGTEAWDWGGVLYLFSNNTAIRAADMDCRFMTFHRRFMEADEVKRRYEPIRRKLNYKLDLSQVPPALANVTAGQTIPGTDYTVQSGSFAVREVASPGKVLVADRDGELTDGDMEAAGVAAWTAGNSATLTKEAGVRTGGGGSQILKIARNGVNNPQARQAGVFVNGLQYRVVGWVRSDGSAVPYWYNGGATATWTGVASASWQYFDVTFAHASGDSQLYLQATTAVGTEYVEYDDVQVYKVQPDRKGIVCVAPGTISRPNPFPFGTSDIEVQKGLGTNQPTVAVLSTDTGDPRSSTGGSGYAWQMNVSTFARVVITEKAGGAPGNIAYTDVDYVDPTGTAYTIRTTRSTSGEFTFYIKGGAFDTWTLIDMTGGFGANPFTDLTTVDSTYRVVFLYAGDILFADEQYQGVITP